VVNAVWPMANNLQVQAGRRHVPPTPPRDIMEGRKGVAVMVAVGESIVRPTNGSSCGRHANLRQRPETPSVLRLSSSAVASE